ncbi:hypothetical protein NFI96_029324, partial [Prochilodus magdalenae]
MGTIFEDTNVYMLHMMYQAMGVCLYMQDWDGAMKYGEKIVQPYSVHYPPYSLNVASMYLKLGRLYLGLEKKPEGVKALKKVTVNCPSGQNYTLGVISSRPGVQLSLISVL